MNYEKKILMNKNILALLTPFVLAGCAGMPVGYGGTHAAIQSSSMSVTYIYDPLVGGRSAAMNAANEYCRGLGGKTAIPSSSGNQGILQIQSYDCRSPEGFASSADEQNKQLSNKMKLGFEKYNKCFDELLQTPVGQQVTKSILVMSDTQANKFDLYTSKSKLNEAQKQTLKTFLTEQSKCVKIMTDTASGTPYALPMAKRFSNRDAVFIKLLSGQMSVGEANMEREQLSIKSREEMMAVGKSIDDGFKNSHNAEVAEDVESKRRLANAMRENQQAQQQQQIINQNQQIINNQINQNNQPIFSKPPIQTDCIRYGNTVNCTTY